MTPTAPGNRKEIAVVGCGIAGMAAAILLHRAGEKVRLFEQFAAPRPVGSGLLLQPTGLSVLRRLGVLPEILAAGARIDRLTGDAHPSGRRILDVAYSELPGGLHGVGIHRATLFDALHRATLADGIAIVPGTAIAKVDDAAGGRPVLIDDRGRRHGPFDLVIDASGAKSQLRRHIAREEPRPFAYGALWTTLPLAGHPLDGATLAQRYVGARKMIGIMPLGRMPGASGPHAAFFWSLRMDGLAAWRDRGLEAWKAEVAAIWPEAGALVAGIDDAASLTPAFYLHYTAKNPIGRNFALIGDAAHATSPQLGQGGNMALIDAAALADAIAGQSDVKTALAAYAAARRRHVRFYQSASALLTPLFQGNSRLAGTARDRLWPVLAHLPYFRRQAAESLAGLKTGLFRSIEVERS